MIKSALFAVLAVSLFACNPTDDSVSVGLVRIDDGLDEVNAQPESVAEEIALLDEIPAREDYPTATEAACHGNSSCPGVVACTGWSGSYDCDGGQCRLTKACCEEDPGVVEGTNTFCPARPGFFQNTEQFRACFYNDGNQCLEFRQLRYLSYCEC